MTLRLAICWAIGLACTGISFSAETTSWLADGWKCRRRVRIPKSTANYGRKRTAVIDFATGGFALRDGRDIRVYARGRPTAHCVLWHGPGSTLRVAFQTLPTVYVYDIYYGNPEAPDPPEWWPKHGLLLETRRYNGGSLADLSQMRKTVKRSGDVYGRNFVPNVFHGGNLFGPSDKYLSTYKGQLWIDQAGKYTFATASDDGSLIVVDNRVVARKPPGGATPDARFHGAPVKLIAGFHSFAYYHVDTTGPQCAVAAWKPPGGKFHVIPPHAFVQPAYATTIGLTIRGLDVAPDIQAINAGEVIFKGKQMVRISFKDRTPGRISLLCQPTWTFGDGTSSNFRNPDHVYFTRGTYPVTFELKYKGKVCKVTHQLVITPAWERQFIPSKDRLNRYFKIIMGYQFDKMKLWPLCRAVDVLEEFGDKESLVAAGRAILAKQEKLTPEQLLRYSIILGKAIRDHEGEYDEAMSIFREAEKKLEAPDAKAKLAVEAGDVLFYFKHDPEGALEEYRRVLRDFAGAEIAARRVAQIRVGDIYRHKGEYEPARNAYRKANEMKAALRMHDRPLDSETVHLGAIAQSIEDYTRRKNFAQAQKLLDWWEWEHPEQKLIGYSSLLRARLAVAREQHYEAINQAYDMVKVNPRCTYAAELLLLAARAQLKVKEFDDAVKSATRIVEEYPDSPLQQDAKRLIIDAFAAAGKHSLLVDLAREHLRQYPESQDRWATMLILADSLLALGRKPAALKVLNAIIKEYPESKMAKQAQDRLNRMSGTRVPSNNNGEK